MNTIYTFRKNGSEYEFKNNILDLKRNDISFLRFNVGKYNSSTYNDLYKEIAMVREQIRDVHILLDLPYPGYKQRLNYPEIKKEIKKGDVFLLKDSDIFCGTESKNTIYMQLETLKLSKGETLFYDNGEGAFRVLERNSKNVFSIVALNSFLLYDGKSLYSKKIKKRSYGRVLNMLCQNIAPDYVALSFIDSEEDLQEAILSKRRNKYKLISKIEENLSDNILRSIIQLSDGIMLGRGDFCITSGIDCLYKIEKKLSVLCKEYKKEYYIATDFLPSVTNQYLPTRSDIIDLSFAISLKPTGLIFNGKIIKFGAIKRVQNIINLLSKNI